jgi:hypothetical protein
MPVFEYGSLPDLTPEQRLLYAVLGRVLADLFSPQLHDRVNAASFITASTSCDTPWSFEWLCLHLNLPTRSFKNHINRNRSMFVRFNTAHQLSRHYIKEFSLLLTATR